MSNSIRRRTRARELALQFLYSLEMQGGTAIEDLQSFLDHHLKIAEDAQEGDQADRDQVAEYAKGICLGVHAKLSELNRWIENIAQNWRLERMAYLDRNILRLAVWELLYQPEIPFKVVINEAIDIAKKYSTAQSGGFVNGILDRARILINEAREKCDGVPPPPSARFVPAPEGAEDVRVVIANEEEEVRTPRPTQTPRPVPFKRNSE